MRRPESRTPRRLRPLAVVAAVLALTACAPELTPPAAPSASAPAIATPDATPAGPTLVPAGTAADNLPLFTHVMNSVGGTDAQVQGAAYVDALTAAGFDREAMQVTFDRTSVDDPADAIQFSVLWKGECLIGQVGPSTPAPTASVQPELPDGGCLLGQTRPIDW